MKTKVAAEIWLDYLDGELEKSFKTDLDKVLLNDPEEREAVHHLKRLKSQIQDSERTLPSNEFFLKLKNNIMNEVQKTTPQKKITIWQKTQNRGMAMATAAGVALVLGVVLTDVELKSHRATMAEKVQKAATNIVQNESVYNELVANQQGNDEFILDAVAEKLSNMSDKQVDKAIENL